MKQFAMRTRPRHDFAKDKQERIDEVKARNKLSA